jgi:hypothetical protein
MRRRAVLALAPALALLPAAAAAEAVLRVEFTGNSPHDDWRFTNVAPCEGVRVDEVRINLATAAGPVFFDAAPGGAGYAEDIAPGLEFFRGRDRVAGIDPPEDGGDTVLFRLSEFTDGEGFQVGIDVDTEDRDAAGRKGDVPADFLDGTTVAALITNPAGESRAELGVMADGVATVLWDLACAGSENDPTPAQD